MVDEHNRAPEQAAVTKMRTVRLLTAVALTGGLVAACASSLPTSPPLSPIVPSPASSPSATAPTADWPTYHRDNARTGLAAGLAPVSGSLQRAWQTTLDGAVYGQPLAVGDMILAATENDTVYALDQGGGEVRWKTNVGTPQPKAQLPCGDISPLGITGTMAYDQPTGRVFAVAETPGGTHTLYGFDVVTGKVVVRKVVDPPKGDPIAHQQRGALTVLNGRVYVAYGALAGDCSNYVGSVVSVTTDGTDPLSYAIPTKRQAGIWGPAGGTVADDTLLYSVGNGSSTTTYDGSDSVIALSPATLKRVDYFAPATWADDNATDLSLGSSNPTLLGQWVYVGTKRTSAYVLRRGSLGGIGGEVTKATVCESYGGTSVADDIAYLPCTDGPRAISIDGNGKVSVLWHAPVQAKGAPTVGGGAVWVADYDKGTLYALDQRTGQVKARIDVGTMPHFASPTLSGSTAYVGTLTGVVAVAGA